MTKQKKQLKILKAKVKADEVAKHIRNGLRKGGIIDEEMVKNWIKYLTEAGEL